MQLRVPRCVVVPAQRAAMRHYRTAELYGRAVVARRSRRAGPPVVVHQMGKVASTAVVRSLEGVVAGPVYHVHALTPEGIGDIRRIYRAAWARTGSAWHLWQSLHLSARLRRPLGEPWSVISLVRDPVARNVSSFFQVGEAEYGIDFAGLAARPWDDEVMAELRDAFLDRFRGHDQPMRFFEEELGAVFGVDVYAAPFPHDRGYDILSGARARILILRVEDLPRCFSEAIERFLDVPDVSLDAANVSDVKAYGPLYQRFRREVSLPATYLDSMYGSRYARHFYGDEELRAFRARWTGAGAPDDPVGGPPSTTASR